MSLKLKKEKLYPQKVKNVYLELLLYQEKRNREYEAIMELIMAQAKTTLATKSKLAKVAKKVKIETPIGTIESDSGNHFLDVGTVLFIVVVLYALKKLIK